MEIMRAIIGVIKTNSSTPTYSDMAVITIFITQNKDLHYARPLINIQIIPISHNGLSLSSTLKLTTYEIH